MFEIGNAYGGLLIKEENGKFYWTIEGYCGDDWHEIPESLYIELLKHSNKKFGK
jgi:hypothetical protein